MPLVPCLRPDRVDARLVDAMGGRGESETNLETGLTVAEGGARLRAPGKHEIPGGPRVRAGGAGEPGGPSPAEAPPDHGPREAGPPVDGGPRAGARPR